MDLTAFMMLMTMVLTSEVTTGIDMTVVDALLEVARTILNMFTIFPLNVFLTAGIVGIVIGIFRKLKRSAK